PMKFFEYLSSGRNIVSVDLKSLKEFRDFCYLSKSYDEFVSNIDRVISGDIVPLDERLSLAKKYTYESRTKKMIKIIEDELRLN
ncbi:TPA: glycosyltransferase family 1 protein, partial [Klebsiella pneumoniae]|nr:glycosyltransferase family 1 protein [Klebsiella pneumoniae]